MVCPSTLYIVFELRINTQHFVKSFLVSGIMLIYLFTYLCILFWMSSKQRTEKKKKKKKKVLILNPGKEQ